MLIVGKRPRPAALLIAAFTLSGALGACETHVPAELEAPKTTPPAETPIGLDARPYNPECKATEKPTSTTTSNALIGFELATKAAFTSPVEVTLHDGKLYVLEQGGKVLLVNDDLQTTSLVADFSTKIVSGGESGLLGIAFHPQFSTNGFVYIYHTKAAEPPIPNVAFQSVLSRYHSNDNGLTLDLASEKRILVIDQPYSNHNGGTIAFGNDGFLYWGLGDGGSGGDPQNNAQNKSSLLGKMLRIDVNGGDPYAIPPSNPFASGVNGRPEIFAYGFRNPYRWRFDTVTGALWAGDVGQGAREEIDKVVLGGNYGWRIKEGKACYAAATCDETGLIDPVVDHGRNEASVITGGVVYRGAGVPLLTGKYVYADFGQGTFFSIPIDEAAPTPMRLDVGLPRVNASAFGIDKNGEIVFVDYFKGTLVRIVAGGKATEPLPEMPLKLSATGCVDARDPKKPAEGLFSYDINVPQWVDGATAERNLSIPESTVIRSGPDGRLALPPGSVAMKTLSREGRLVETQLLLQRPDATWSAYAYVWSGDQTDATLVTTSTTVALPSGKQHLVVDSQQCLTCHLVDVVPTIGLEAAQLDRDDVKYGPTRLGNPLATLEKLKMLDEPVPRDRYTRLPGPSGFQLSDARARAYLHANCSHCHRGGDNGAIDLRYGTKLADARLCDVPGTSKAGGRVRLAPRSPADSQLVRAMTTTGDGKMPPVGTLLPDTAGIDRTVAGLPRAVA